MYIPGPEDEFIEYWRRADLAKVQSKSQQVDVLRVHITRSLRCLTLGTDKSSSKRDPACDDLLKAGVSSDP